MKILTMKIITRLESYTDYNIKYSGSDLKRGTVVIIDDIYFFTITDSVNIEDGIFLTRLKNVISPYPITDIVLVGKYMKSTQKYFIKCYEDLVNLRKILIRKEKFKKIYV